MFGLAPTGEPFVLFGASHLLAVATVVAACIALAVGTPRLGPRGQASLRWSLASFALANSLAWDLWQRAHGIWSAAYSLPVHLCTLSVPLAALMLATRSRRLYEVLYFWGFAGATQALITPDLQASGHNFPHFVYLIFWTSHGVILWALIFAAAAWRYRPTAQAIITAFLATNALLVAVGLINRITGGNYMFLARPPAYATLLDLLGPWPWYLLVGQGLALLAFVLVYLPYAVADWRAGRDLRC